MLTESLHSNSILSVCSTVLYVTYRASIDPVDMHDVMTVVVVEWSPVVLPRCIYTLVCPWSRMFTRTRAYAMIAIQCACTCICTCTCARVCYNTAIATCTHI